MFFHLMRLKRRCFRASSSALANLTRFHSALEHPVVLAQLSVVDFFFLWSNWKRSVCMLYYLESCGWVLLACWELLTDQVS